MLETINSESCINIGFLPKLEMKIEMVMAMEIEITMEIKI
jgi:hypothetical protein